MQLAGLGVSTEAPRGAFAGHPFLDHVSVEVAAAETQARLTLSVCGKLQPDRRQRLRHQASTAMSGGKRHAREHVVLDVIVRSPLSPDSNDQAMLELRAHVTPDAETGDFWHEAVLVLDVPAASKVDSARSAGPASSGQNRLRAVMEVVAVLGVGNGQREWQTGPRLARRAHFVLQDQAMGAQGPA